MALTSKPTVDNVLPKYFRRLLSLFRYDMRRRIRDVVRAAGSEIYLLTDGEGWLVRFVKG
jgi:hypothetical protein